MRVNRIAVNRLATLNKQGNLPGFLPADQPAQPLLGWVTKVDQGRNQISVTLNDYGDPHVDGIAVRGDGTNLPAVGELVQLEYAGNTLQMVGRQYRPVGSVTFG